ncbi:MAG: hypothetical protein PHH16_01140 [Candidatus Gracilibacteria bacterium]|nr:hypothetical protein [Candidatus Gracilibacteria bacterium]
MKTTMEQESKTPDKKSSKNTILVLSTTLFAIVCAISAFLFFENMRLSASIEANKNEIAEYTSSIEKIKSDKKVIAAELVANNKSDILGTIKASEAQRYIEELLNISKKYKMIFSGFSYENGKISTSAVSIPETVLVGDDGVKKISTFIKDYRTGTGLLFRLSPVLSISGYEQKRTFSIEFNVDNVK